MVVSLVYILIMKHVTWLFTPSSLYSGGSNYNKTPQRLTHMTRSELKQSIPVASLYWVLIKISTLFCLLSRLPGLQISQVKEPFRKL